MNRLAILRGLPAPGVERVRPRPDGGWRVGEPRKPGPGDDFPDAGPGWLAAAQNPWSDSNPNLIGLYLH